MSDKTMADLENILPGIFDELVYLEGQVAVAAAEYKYLKARHEMLVLRHSFLRDFCLKHGIVREGESVRQAAGRRGFGKVEGPD